MPSGLRAFEFVMGGVADAAERANDQLNRNADLLARRRAELQAQIDSAPAVVAARARAAEIETAIKRLSEMIEAASAKQAENLRDDLQSLLAQRIKSDAVLADIQTEIDARFDALGGDGERAPVVRNGRFGARAAGETIVPSAAAATGAALTEAEELYDRFRDLNATEFDVEEVVTQQREIIEEIRRLGFGEYLDAFAVASERTRRGDVTPQAARALSVAMEQVRGIIRDYAGPAGRKFNFALLEREITQLARDARDARRDRQLGRRSGAAGKEPAIGKGEGPSLAILRKAGGLR